MFTYNTLDISPITADFLDRFFGNGLTKDKVKDIKADTLEVDIPGYAKEEIDIKLDKGILTITANNKARGAFKTAYTLNVNKIHLDTLTSTLLNGVLTFEWKSPEPKETSKKIEIK